MRRTPSGVGRLVRGALLALVAAVVLGGGATEAAPWDERDVAAAESYRAAERERADRYRARVAQRKAPLAERPRAETPDRPNPQAGEGWIATLWERTADALVAELQRAGAAFLSEFDRAAIESAFDAARSGWTWWKDEASPRVHRIWDVLAEPTS